MHRLSATWYVLASNFLTNTSDSHVFDLQSDVLSPFFLIRTGLHDPTISATFLDQLDHRTPLDSFVFSGSCQF
jgi:hypothetical protein